MELEAIRCRQEVTMRSELLIATIVLSAAGVFASGCDVPSKSPTVTVESARAYFQALPLGCAVTKIEADLGLPAPSETEAPASDWPSWKFRYMCRNVVIFFEAERSQSNGRAGQFTYAGDPIIMSREEYWRSLSDKVQK